MNGYKIYITGVIIFLSSFSPIHGQETTGIFLTLALEKENCEHALQLKNRNEFYCLSNDPVIKLEDLDSISEIYQKYKGLRWHIDIVLSPDGQKTLRELTSLSKRNEIGVVVKGQLVSIIILPGKFNASQITLWDNRKSFLLEWVYQELHREIGIMKVDGD